LTRKSGDALSWACRAGAKNSRKAPMKYFIKKLICLVSQGGLEYQRNYTLNIYHE